MRVGARVGAYIQDALAPDGYRLGARGRRVAGPHAGVPDDDVGVLAGRGAGEQQSGQRGDTRDDQLSHAE